MISRCLLLIIPLAWLAGCSDNPPESARQPPGGPPKILEDQMRALDKARSVEQTIMDAAQQRDPQAE